MVEMFGMPGTTSGAATDGSHAYDVAEGTPLVIDNGAYRCRAGWASDDAPRLSFLNMSAKYRQRKENEPNVVVGSDIPSSDWSRLNYRSPFDGNVVVNFTAQENVLDHIFSRLSIDGGRVSHPVVMTEALCNPNYCREGVSELLFECYDVPAVSYGIDAMFAYYHHETSRGTHDANNLRRLNPGLIVAASHRSTHVIPLPHGLLDPSNSKRLNLGGQNMTQLLMRLVQIKQPLVSKDVIYDTYEAIMHEHCYFAADYQADIASCASRDGIAKIARTLQIPFNQQVAAEKSAEERERAQQKRREQGLRLQQMAMQRRAEKLRSLEEQLQQHLDTLESKPNVSRPEFLERMQMLEVHNEGELNDAIKRLQTKIKQLRAKQMGIDEPAAEEKEEDTKKYDFSLLDVPDEMLADEQIKEKRKQKLIKGGIEARERARQAKALQKLQEEEEARKDEQLRLEDFATWRKNYVNRRAEILIRVNERKRKKEQLSDRRSAASMQRMRSIAALADNDEKGSNKRRRTGNGGSGGGAGKQANNDDDTFGADDNDWLVYREISKEEDSDEEEEDLTQLAQVEAALSKHDPDFDADKVMLGERNGMLAAYQTGFGDGTTIAEDYQLHLSVERIRVPEILFQPHIVGVDQASLPQLIQSVFAAYDAPTQAAMAKNVLLTGGVALMPGFQNRMALEMTQIRPFQSPLTIHRAQSAQDSWRGARLFARSTNFASLALTRAQYNELGHDYLIEHALSNTYHAVPKSTD